MTRQGSFDIELKLTGQRPRRPRWPFVAVAVVAVVGCTIALLAVTNRMGRHLEAWTRFEAKGALVNWDWYPKANAERGSTSVNLSTAGAAGRISDSDITYLEGFENLTSLDLSRCSQLTPQGLRNLSRLVTLRDLTLNSLDDAPGVRFTDADVDCLRPLVKLQSLSLVHTAITDAGVARLDCLVNLEMLDLSETVITDATLVYIETHFPKLASLAVEGTNVTPEGLRRLSRKRPQIAIHHPLLFDSNGGAGGSEP